MKQGNRMSLFVGRTWLRSIKDLRLRLEGCENRTVTRLRQLVDKEPLKACAMKTAEQMVTSQDMQEIKNSTKRPDRSASTSAVCWAGFPELIILTSCSTKRTVHFCTNWSSLMHQDCGCLSMFEAHRLQQSLHLVQLLLTDSGLHLDLTDDPLKPLQPKSRRQQCKIQT